MCQRRVIDFRLVHAKLDEGLREDLLEILRRGFGELNLQGRAVPLRPAKSPRSCAWTYHSFPLQ